MAYKLSNGSLEIIMNGGYYEKPVVQVLGNHKFQRSGTNERFGLEVSDGKHFHSFAVLATHLNNKLITGELSDYSVIQIEFFTSFSKTNKGHNQMVIKAITILAPGTEVGRKLGNPQLLMPATTSALVSSSGALAPTAHQSPTSSLSTTAAAPSLNSTLIGSIMPIANLMPYQYKWVVKARVINKSVIQRWSGARGNGIYFKIKLCDDSGEIGATAFNNECDKFYNMIQVDKVYYFSHCQIKAANKQYNKLKNDYEMTFKSDTEVLECMDDISMMPTIKYDFVPISEIANKSCESILDAIGICKGSDLHEFTAKNSGKMLKKREITLVDQTGAAITLSLWGSAAESFDGSTNPVIAVKGARLAEFNGSKSLSCLGSTMLRTNPDLPDAHRLRGWYDHGGATAELVNISARKSVSSSGIGEWLTFSETNARRFGSGVKGDYYNLLGVLTCTFSDNVVYKACPQQQCNKKLLDQENGLFQCEKCNKEYINYKYRLILSANLSDPTGDQKITAFNEVAEVMLGHSAEKVARMLDCDKNRYAQLFDEIKFKTFLFRLRTETDILSNDARLKTTVISAKPINYQDANARFVTSIKVLSGIEV